MKFIELGFRLGVVFAIFAFLWGILQLILRIFRGNRPKSVAEEYILKFVQYFFLVNVTFLFCIQKGSENELLMNELFCSGLILAIYFIGKLQTKQQRLTLFQISGRKLPNFQPLFNLYAEVASIIFGIGVFTALIFFPEYANNPISTWFYKNILDIEGTFFFGFIFKIIGFFVLVSILFKLINGIMFLLSGRPLASVKSEFNNEKRKKDDFDDFEEVN